MNNLNFQNEKEIFDTSQNKIFRKSSLGRIILGTIGTTTCCFFYSFCLARYKNYSFSFIKNWIKGSLCFSFLFYTSNEFLFSLSKFYSIYTNYWINYTAICYFLSKMHYRYLIRYHSIKWYNAIKYSHKCFLYMCVINLILETFIYLTREIYLFSEDDIFDIVHQKFYDENNNPNYNLSYEDVEKNFMKSFHIINSQSKMKRIEKYIYEKKLEDKDNNRNNSNINTINLYDFYKNKKF